MIAPDCPGPPWIRTAIDEVLLRLALPEENVGATPAEDGRSGGMGGWAIQWGSGSHMPLRLCPHNRMQHAICIGHPRRCPRHSHPRRDWSKREERKAFPRRAPSDVVEGVRRVGAAARADDDDVLHASGLGSVHLVALPLPVDAARGRGYAYTRKATVG